MEIPPAGRKGSFLLVALLLLISVLLEQYWFIRLLPWLGELGGLQPMIIFLDIPLRLPVIDWIPVGILFVFLYLVVISPELARHRSAGNGPYHTSPSRAKLLRQKSWSLLTGWCLLLLFLVASGGLYYLLEDQLPKQVRNGIDSFGFRADLSIPFHEDIVHLHGGMIMLVALIIGGRLFFKRTLLPVITKPDPGAVPGIEHTNEEAAIELYAPIPQPQSVKLPPGPAPAMVRPCVVNGVLEPS